MVIQFVQKIQCLLQIMQDFAAIVSPAGMPLRQFPDVAFLAGNAGGRLIRTAFAVARTVRGETDEAAPDQFFGKSTLTAGFLFDPKTHNVL